jgi:hypothetical protein
VHSICRVTLDSVHRASSCSISIGRPGKHLPRSSIARSENTLRLPWSRCVVGVVERIAPSPDRRCVSPNLRPSAFFYYLRLYSPRHRFEGAGELLALQRASLLTAAVAAPVASACNVQARPCFYGEPRSRRSQDSFPMRRLRSSLLHTTFGTSVWTRRPGWRMGARSRVVKPL